MLIGLHPDKTGKESYSDKFIEFFTQHNIEVKILDLLSTSAIAQAQDCDGVMWRWLHKPSDKQSARQILNTIESYLKIPVFPNSTTAWHYDDKLSQKYIFDALQVPAIPTWIFWNKNEALNWLQNAEYPIIFKLSGGAGSANVIKIDNKEQGEKTVNKMFQCGFFPYTENEFKHNSLNAWLRNPKVFKSRLKEALLYFFKKEYPPLHKTWWKPEFGYAYFQKFLPNNKFDTRVTVIGKRAFAYRRFNRPDDFRASGSGNFDVDPKQIDVRCIELAFRVSRMGKFQSMAYDFIYDQNKKPVIGEMSYTFVDWMVEKCPGHWDQNLNWVEGNMWPEYAIAEDFVSEVHNRITT